MGYGAFYVLCPRASSQSVTPLNIGERNGEIEYRNGKVLQRRRASGGNVRLPHLLMSFFCH